MQSLFKIILSNIIATDPAHSNGVHRNEIKDNGIGMTSVEQKRIFDKRRIENFKKRSEKEINNAYKFSTEGIFLDLIPIYESFDFDNEGKAIYVQWYCDWTASISSLD